LPVQKGGINIKAFCKLLGVIAVGVIIGFGLPGCDNPVGDPGSGTDGALSGATNWDQTAWETWFEEHPASDAGNAQAVAQFAANNATWVAEHSWWSPLYSAWVADGSGQQYTVTFVVDGSAINTQTVAKGQGATLPANPAKTGYTFDGWEGDYNNVISDRTITAKWKIIKYTVTFVDGDGNTLYTQQVEHGKNIAPPATPTKTGYTFEGWYKEAACTTAWKFADAADADAVFSNTTLYAKWMSKAIADFSFSVIFDTPGDQTIALSDITQGIDRSLDGALNVTDSTNYDATVANRAWYVGSNQLAGESSDSITLSARNYVAGTYSLSERVTLQDGRVYSKTVKFTVVE
jgi:uncharacterized repeat protein (TIGR02543 family)